MPPGVDLPLIEISPREGFVFVDCIRDGFLLYSAVFAFRIVFFYFVFELLLELELLLLEDEEEDEDEEEEEEDDDLAFEEEIF